MKTRSSGRFVRLWLTVLFVVKTFVLFAAFYFTTALFISGWIIPYFLKNPQFSVTLAYYQDILVEMPLIRYYKIIHIIVFAVLFLIMIFNYCKSIMMAEIAEDIAAIRDDVEAIRRRER